MRVSLRLLAIHLLLSAIQLVPEILLSRQVGGKIHVAALALSVAIFAFPPSLFFLASNRFALSWAIWLMVAALLVAIHAAKYRFLQSPLFLTDFFPATVQTTLGVLPGLSLSLKLLAALLLIGFLAGIFFVLRRVYARSAKASLPFRAGLCLACGALPLLLLFAPQEGYEKILPAIGASASDFSRPFSLNRMGFMGSLWHDVRYLVGQKKPAGYSEAAMHQIREKYASRENPKTPRDISVIILLLESFWDPLVYSELKVSPDPIPYFRSLQKKFPHGNVRVPMYGGGTALAEFEILTGMPTSEIRGYPYVNLRRRIPSLATVLAKRGYGTTFLHGYKHWFYARDRAVPLMGFDKFLYRDHIYAAFPGTDIEDIRYIKDEYFMRMLFGLTNQRPYFIFASSYGTHGPYVNEHDVHPYALNTALGAKTRDALQANFMLLKQADDSLRQLVTALEKTGRETLIFAFGDHVPSESYIHLDLRQYDKEKPFWLPYVLIRTRGKGRIEKSVDLHTTAVVAFILREVGINSGAQYAATRTGGDSTLVVYDLLFGDQLLEDKE